MSMKSGNIVLLVSLGAVLILLASFSIRFFSKGQGHRNLTNSDFAQTPATFFPDQYFQEKPSPYFHDEVEINWVSSAGFPATARINLPSKKWFYSGACANPSAFAQSPEMPLTDEEVGSIRQLLASLPATSGQSYWNRDDYKNEYHVAYYAGEKLINCHYSKSSLPVKFEDLLKFLKIDDFYK